MQPSPPTADRRLLFGLHIRLIVAIPLVMTLFTLAGGFLTFNLTTIAFLPPYAALPLESKRKFLEIISTLLALSFIVLGVGIVLGYSISRPLRRLATLAGGLLSNAPGEALRSRPTNELGELVRTFDQVVSELNFHALDRQVLESIEQGIVTLNQDGIITSMNAAAAWLLNCDTAEAIGKGMSQVVGDGTGAQALLHLVEEVRKTAKSAVGQIDLGGGPKAEYHLTSVTVSPLRDFQGQAVGLLLTMENLSAREVVRRQLSHAGHLATLGSWAASLAHEIRNPLGYLQGLVELLAADLPAGDAKRAYTDAILRGVDRLNKTMEDLLQFSRLSKQELTEAQLTDLLHEALVLCRFEFSEKPVVVQEQYQEGLPPILADHEKLRQALGNLVHNAFEATPQGGTITLSAAVSESFIPSPRGGGGKGGGSSEGSPGAQRPSSGGEDPRVVITSANTGSYIPPDQRDKIFTPFYSTKPAGTGLGLSMARHIILAHSGSVSVDSDPQTGTRFRVELPVHVMP